MQLGQIRKFTTRYTGVATRLETDVKISEYFNPDTPPFDFSNSITQNDVFTGLWDTGATNSVITTEVIQRLNLQSIGFTNVSGVHGTQTVKTFFVCLYLPNGVYFDGIRVTEGILPAATTFFPKKVDVLIGMDIITKGDFAITYNNNKTIFSFQCPPSVEIDFTSNCKPFIGVNLPGRSAPCPCGSGKKYKKCHGR